MGIPVTVITAILCLFLALNAAPAAAAAAAAGEVTIKADTLSQDREKEIVQATGNVEIHWDAATLYSQMATFDQRRNEAVASGKVRLVRDGDRLEAERLRVEVDTELGEVENGYLFLQKPNFHLRGARMAKTGLLDYRLSEGRFTTCDGPSPSWSFAADDLEVTLEEYATGRHAFFYIHDLPVFYFPYLVFPVKRERQSGLLFPRVGSSNKKGAYLDLPWYWAISPSRDATIDLDLQSKRGAGLGVEYRYLSPRDGHGEFRSYSIYDTREGLFRGDLTLYQYSYPVERTFFRSAVNLVTDRSFYRDYGVASGDYNRQYLESTAALTRHWQSTLLTGELRWLNDLDSIDNRQTLQRLPTITLLGVGERLGTLPLYLTFDAGFTHFYRQAGAEGERFDLRPRLAWATATPAGIGLSLWGGYRERLYNAYNSGESGDWHSIGTAEAGAVLSASLSRVYPVDWGEVRRLKHELRPEVSFSYLQEREQTTLPFFDFDDRPLGGQLLSWSLASIFTGREEKGESVGYRELFALKLSQGYQLSGPARDPQSGSPRDLLTLVDDGRPLTDIRLEGRLTPLKQVTLAAESRFSPYRAGFNSAAVGLQLDDQGGNKAGISYRTAREQLEYLEGSLAVAALKPFFLTYNGRYSFDRGGFLESVYGVVYRHQCWSVTMTYRDRPDNREFTVNFALAGIGALGSLRAF